MKPPREQNFYEIFEIPATATREQIEQAYELAKKTYGDASLAAYSLFDLEERKEIVRKIHLAYETLSDENRRKQYDREIMKLDIQETLPPSGSAAMQTTRGVDRPDSSGEKPPKSEPVPIVIESLTGSELRRIRESRGIPLQEIANKTRINITYLEFLEKNKYGSLPPPVYLRSYVLQYARMLGLDPIPLADRILSLVEQAKKSDQQ
ncbi:MAG: helix-turn-helix domain-containing protein [Nitrospirae bacterium]|nr:helix-turn-helix domain-containing protein [Nitrospirota bacterium]